MPDHRICGEANNRRDHRHISERIAPARAEGHVHPCRHHATVRQAGDENMPAGAAMFPAPMIEHVIWKRLTRPGDQPAAGIVHGNIGVEGVGKTVQSCLERCGIGVRRQHRGEKTVASAAPAAVLFVLAQAHEYRACYGHHGEARQKRQVDLHKQAVAHSR